MKTLLHLALAASSLMMVCGTGFSAGTEFVPSPYDIASLEKAIRLPEGSEPLGKYLRFYAGKVENGKHTIVAVLKLDPTRAGIEIVDLAHLPVVFDGECSSVDVQYDVEAGSFKGVTCNGVA
jgi:hypothetical protein